MTVLASRDAHVPALPAGRRTVRLLAAAAVALVLSHWLRLLPLGFQAPGATRYEDFADLLTPYVVAGPALAALAATGASRRTWTVALLGAAAFVQGHGIHLSANSIRHAVGPVAPVDLWDEQVGHWIWFVGLTALTAAVVHAVAATVPAARWGPVLAGLVGLTWAANVVEAGMAALGIGARVRPGRAGVAPAVDGHGPPARARLRAVAGHRRRVGRVVGRVPAAQRARVAVEAVHRYQPLTVALPSTRSPSYSTAA